MTKTKLLDLVAIKDDLPGFYLRAGDCGTVVEVYDGGQIEVEFVDDNGDTVAVLTMSESDIRKLGKGEEGIAPKPLPGGVEAPIADATAAVRP
jgi:hypothetical protein